MALRIVFCGTPAFAVPSLERLIRDPDFKIEAVVTQPDRPRGRGREITPSPVKEVAARAKIAIYQPEKIKSYESYEFFKGIAPDAVVIIAYGQIISQKLIELPRLGWINLHASLLPKYRGAAPINWAIMNGEMVSGLTTIAIDSGLDTGPILLQRETEIGVDETAPELTARLAHAGAPLVVQTLLGLARNEISPRPQDNAEASFAPPLEKVNGRIDWRLSALHIYRQIRALDPWPGAFTSFRGKNCQIWAKPLAVTDFEAEPGKHRLEIRSASTSRLPTKPPGLIEVSPVYVLVRCAETDALVLEFVQLEGRNRVTVREFLNGARLVPGERFDG